MNYDPNIIILNYGTTYTSDVPNNSNCEDYKLDINNNSIIIDKNTGIINILDHLEVGTYNFKIYCTLNNQNIFTNFKITIKQNIIYNLNNISKNCQLVPILYPQIKSGSFSIDISNSNILLDCSSGIINCCNLNINNYCFTITWTLLDIVSKYFINFTIKPTIYYNINESYITYNSIGFSEKPIIDPSNNFIIDSQNKISHDGIIDFSNYDVGLHKILVNININNIRNYTTYNLYVLPEIIYNPTYTCTAFTEYYTNKPLISQLGGIFTISGYYSNFTINKDTGIIYVNAPTNIYILSIYYYKSNVFSSTIVTVIVNPTISYNNILTYSNIISYSNPPITNESIDGSFNLINYNFKIDSNGIIELPYLIPNIYLLNIVYSKNNCSAITDCKVTVNPYLNIITDSQTIKYGSCFEYVNFEIMPNNIQYTLICNNPNVLIFDNYISLENFTNIGNYIITLTLTINNQSVYKSYTFNILPNIYYPNKLNYGVYNQEFISDLPIINPYLRHGISFYLVDCNYVIIDSNNGLIKTNNLDVGKYCINIYYTYLTFKIPIIFELIITPLLNIPNQNIIFNSTISGIIYNPDGGTFKYRIPTISSEIDYSTLNSGTYNSNITYTYNNIEVSRYISLNILKKELNLNLISIDKVFDNTTNVDIVCYDISNIIINANYENSSIGLNKKIIINYLVLPDYLDLNYYFNIKNLSGNIFPRIIEPYIYGFNKIYDGTKNANISISSNLVNIISYNSQFITCDIGLQRININNLKIDNNNFLLSSESYTISAFIFAKDAYLKFNVEDKIYDGSNNCSIILQSITGLINRDFIVIYNINAKYSNINVGYNSINILSYEIKGYNSSNYKINILDFSGNIKPREVNLQIFSIDKIYNSKFDANIYFNSSYNIISYNANYLDKSVNTKKIIKVTDILLDNNNFFVSDCTLYGNILPFLLEFDFSGNNKIYDGNTICTGVYSINPIPGDNVSCVYNSDFKNYFYGENKEIAITNLKLIGNESNNYKISSIKTNRPSIFKKELSINFISIDKMYDKTTFAFVKLSSISGFLKNINIINLDATYEDYYCGNNKLINIKNIVLEKSFINYYVNDTFCYGNILPQELNLNIKNIVKYYDGTPDVKLTITNINNILPNDTVYIESYNAYFNDSNVGSMKIVNINNISLIGKSSNNYICNNFKMTGTINHVELPLNFIAFDQEYNQNMKPIITCNIDISSFNATYTNIEVGQQKILISNIILKDFNNYFVSDQVIKGNILPKKIDLKFKAFDKVYNSTSDVIVIYDLTYFCSFNAYFEDSNIGLKKVYIMDISLNSYNYYTDSNIIVHANILPYEIKISPNINKIYDGTLEGTIMNLDTCISGISIISYTANFDSVNAGINKLVYVNNIILNNNNYFIKDFTISGIIYQKLTDILFNIEDKIYDSTINVNITDISNVVSYNAFYNTCNVGLNTVTIENIVLLDTNYKLNNKVFLSKINPKLLEIEFIINSKIYDNNTIAFIDSYNILNAFDNINIISYTARYVNTGVGLQKIIINDILLDSLNYYATEYFTYSNITPRLLKLSFINVNKIYDKTTDTNVEIDLVNNIIDGDNVKILHFNSNYEDYMVKNNISIYITNIIFNGSDYKNYYINNVIIQGSILPRPIKCSFSLINNLIIGSLDGVINSDNVMINNYISFNDDNNINIQNITLSGLDKSNYYLKNDNFLIYNI